MPPSNGSTIISPIQTIHKMSMKSTHIPIDICQPLARCLEPEVSFLCQIPLPQSPSPRVRLSVPTGPLIGLGPSGRRLVANFWRQVPPQMAKLLLQVVNLSQDLQFWNQNEPKVALLGAKMPLRTPTFKILETIWTHRIPSKKNWKIFKKKIENVTNPLRFGLLANLYLLGQIYSKNPLTFNFW